MAGVRLGHENLKNTTLVLFHPTKKYKNGPYLCPKCNVSHVHKSYHLDLDDQGTVIVSVGVFNALRELGLPGLSILNEVPNPPVQFLSMGGQTVAVELTTADDVDGSRFSVIRNKLFSPRTKKFE